MDTCYLLEDLDGLFNDGLLKGDLDGFFDGLFDVDLVGGRRLALGDLDGLFDGLLEGDSPPNLNYCKIKNMATEILDHSKYLGSKLRLAM
jgi:hypothetical protein